MDLHLYESLDSVVKHELKSRATCTTPETTSRQRHQETPRQDVQPTSTLVTTRTQKEAKLLVGSEISAEKNPPSDLKYSYVCPKKKRAKATKSTYFESSPASLRIDKKDLDWLLNLQDAYSKDQVQQTKEQKGVLEISAKKNPASDVCPKKKRAKVTKSTYIESSPSDSSLKKDLDWLLNLEDTYSKDQVQLMKERKGVSSNYGTAARKGKAPAQMPSELQACFSSDQKGKPVRKRDTGKLESRRKKKPVLAVEENEMADSPHIPPRLYLLDPEFAKEIEKLELDSVEGDTMVGESHSGIAVIGGTSRCNSQPHSCISEGEKAAVSSNSQPYGHASLNTKGEKAAVTGHGSLNTKGKKAPVSRNSQPRTKGEKAAVVGYVSLNTKGKKPANISLNTRGKKPHVQSPNNAAPLSQAHDNSPCSRKDSPLDGKSSHRFSCDATPPQVTGSHYTVSKAKASGGTHIPSRDSRRASSEHIKVPSLGADLSQKQVSSGGMKTCDGRISTSLRNTSARSGSSSGYGSKPRYCHIDGSKPQYCHFDASSAETPYRTTNTDSEIEPHYANIRSGDQGSTVNDHHYQPLIPHSIHSCEEKEYAEIQTPETRLRMISRKLTDEKEPMKGVSNNKMRTELENLFESKLQGNVFSVCKDKVRYI